MQIEILKAGEVRKEGKYFKFELTYSRDGKPSSRTLVAVGDTKPVFEVLKDAKQGDVYEIDLRKDGEYYNWIGCTKGASLTVTSGSNVPATDGKSSGNTSSYKSTNTYETPDERAKKQVYIARMSALAQAIAYGGQENDEQDILAMAKRFESYIMGYELESDKLEDIETK